MFSQNVHTNHDRCCDFHDHSVSFPSIMSGIDVRQRGNRESVEFSLKGPVSVSINDDQRNSSGCSVLDLNFSTPSQVGEVSFRNYYTMWLSVLVKMKLPAETTGTNIGSLPAQHKDENISDWLISVSKKVLMNHPHHEPGSHDMVSISCSESCIEWKDLISLRLILRQPSPVWRTFHVEEINVYHDIPRRAPGKDSNSESLIMLIKRQTINALKWAPTTEGQNQTGAYEFTSLPAP